MEAIKMERLTSLNESILIMIRSCMMVLHIFLLQEGLKREKMVNYVYFLAGQFLTRFKISTSTSHILFNSINIYLTIHSEK